MSRRPTLLFLTAGPYFWTNQRTILAKYEALSSRFKGFVLSFVSGGFEARRLGDFELIVKPISQRLYQNPVLRTLVRAAFFVGTAVRLHWRRERIDAVVAYDPFITGALGLLISRLTGARLIVEVNGDYLNPANWSVARVDLKTRLKLLYVRIAVPFVLNRAHAVRVCYPGQMEPYQGLRETAEYQVFPDFVATTHFSSPASAGDGYLLFIGHPWHTKGVDILIKAFNAIAESTHHELWIVGYLPERLQCPELYEGNAKIRFVGPVMPDDVIGLMTGCRALVLASRSEGMPRVLMEAWAARKAIVAPRVGGIPHHVRHGETGLLFDREDVDGLAQALKHILADDMLVEELAERGYRYASAQLSEDRYVSQFAALVDQALATRRERT